MGFYRNDGLPGLCGAETILSVLNQCDDEEFELATKKELKSCIYLETYGKKKTSLAATSAERWQCFNSPLARIVTGR